MVGREKELGEVVRFLDRVPAGPAALVIEGEPGIGKTTVWLEGVAAAEARAYRVLQARPAESEARLSYAAVADLVGVAFDEARAALPAPQERALAAALLRSDVGEPAEMRTTATALVGVLAALAAERPLLVAVDDVQWLDPASERALEFVARRLPPRLGLLLARRDGSGAAPLGLDRALPDDRLARLVPGPLSLGALHHLLENRLGTAPARPVLARLDAACGGNPFLVLEIARALAVGGGERASGDPLPVPHSLQELVATRVRALSAAAQEVVLVAACLSRPTVGTVAEALAASGDVGAALLEAEEAGVLVSEGGRIRFVHPLLATAVHGSTSAERRRQLHRRLARVVADGEERARHLAQGTVEADEAAAAEIEAASQQAALRGAHDAAAELSAAACRLTPVDRPEGLARRTLGQASALLTAGDVPGARACAVAAAAGAGSLRARAFFLLADIAWAAGTIEVARDHLERALEEVAEDSQLRGRIYSKLVAFNVGFDPGRAVRYADAAAEVLGEEREPGPLGYVLINRLFSEALVGRGARRELLRRGLELEAMSDPDVARSAVPLIWFACMDEVEAARARHAVENRWARDHGDERLGAERLGHLALVELRAGRCELAERYAEESCDALAQFDPRGPWAMPFGQRSLVDAHLGRSERARATLLPLVADAERSESVWWQTILLSQLAFVEFAAGNDAETDSILTRMRGLLDSLGVVDALPDRSEPFHIESLLALGELDRAREVLARLEERGRTLPRPWISATLPRAHALVLAAEGDLAAAMATLESAPDAPELPFELGWTLLLRGRLHRRAKHKRAAADSLRQALELFERLGAPAFAERARAELGRVGLRQRPPHELSATEQRVAELAAGGLTNREVAKSAFMSPKTVEANLARVYRKLGIRSRAELGARMGGRGGDASTKT